MNTAIVVSASPLRRLGAVVYDALLVLALLFVVTAVLVLPYGEAVTQANTPLWFGYRILLAASGVAFFVYFWTRKGRTLGMQAWHLRIETLNGGLPSAKDALVRLLFASIPWAPGLVTIAIGAQSNSRALVNVGSALFGLVLLNYAAAWWDPDRRSLHDRLLKTRIVKR